MCDNFLIYYFICDDSNVMGENIILFFKTNDNFWGCLKKGGGKFCSPSISYNNNVSSKEMNSDVSEMLLTHTNINWLTVALTLNSRYVLVSLHL